MNKPTNETVITATSASTAEPFNAEKETVTQYGVQAEEQPKPIFGPLPIGYPAGTATNNNTDNK